MAVVVPGCSVVPPPLNGVPGDTVVSGGVAVVVVAGSFVVPRPRKGVLTAFVVASRVDDVVVSFSVVSWLRGVRLEAIFVACCMAVNVAIVGRSVVTGLPRDVLNASVAKGVVSARGAFPAGRFVFVVRTNTRTSVTLIMGGLPLSRAAIRKVYFFLLETFSGLIKRTTPLLGSMPNVLVLICRPSHFVKK